MANEIESRRVPALLVRQWLAGWDKIKFSVKEHRRKPEPHFFLFSLPAVELRSLCGIARRQASDLTPRSADLGIQREHDRERSDEIGQFVEFGYPWSTLSEAKRRSAEFNNLRKPGWLPTAIVINILKPSDAREGRTVSEKDTVSILANKDASQIVLPYAHWTKNWRPSSIPPFEVIDGQHRLWAFDSSADPNFELPVVAFHGLDFSWQAYLFWTINIKPKRINPSLAFDLYPLLRAEDWLEQGEGHAVYRETRAQELTESLWSHPESPWYDKINMLGERQNPWVTQSAWIKSLMSTFVRRWHGRGSKIGGLFGSRLVDSDDVLGWSRAQQAAFLLFSWQRFYAAVAESKAEWAGQLRKEARVRLKTNSLPDDPAFFGPYSLINTDQGVRGYLHVLNDMCFTVAPRLDLRAWRNPVELARPESASDTKAVSVSLQSLIKTDFSDWLEKLAAGLAAFDWRTSATPPPYLSDDMRRQKLVFRGSSGYKEIRLQLLEHLAADGGEVGRVAARLQEVS